MKTNEHKTRCKHGHLMDGDNVFINKRDGRRICKKCRKNRQDKFLEKNPPITRKPRMDWRNNYEAGAILIRMYPDHTSKEIAASIGAPCTSGAVNKRAQEMGLKKSEAFCLRNTSSRKKNVDDSTPEYAPISRITHPKPGVTIHRIM